MGLTPRNISRPRYKTPAFKPGPLGPGLGSAAPWGPCPGARSRWSPPARPWRNLRRLLVSHIFTPPPTRHAIGEGALSRRKKNFPRQVTKNKRPPRRGALPPGSGRARAALGAARGLCFLRAGRAGRVSRRPSLGPVQCARARGAVT